MIPRIVLATQDAAVVAPDGVVYSTNPQVGEGADGVPYVMKGILEDEHGVKYLSLEVVFAEIVGAELAREVGLLVPNVAVIEENGEALAGSVEIQDPIRYIAPLLERRHKITNFPDLFNAVVVDVWLANKDRNIGNILGGPIPDTKNYTLVFIDFEKSAALRKEPLTRSTMLDPKLLWPSGELGMFLAANKPRQPPAEIISRINEITRERCEEIIADAVQAIQTPITWHDDSAHALKHRAERIQQLAEEVWATV